MNSSISPNDILPLSPCPEEMSAKSRTTQCRLCGKWLRKLSMIHLRKHGLDTKSQYYSLITAYNKLHALESSSVPEDKVSLIATLILKGLPIPDVLISSLAEVQRSVISNLTLCLDSVRLRRLLRLQKLVDGMDNIDNKLYDPSLINKLSFRDLLNLAEYSSSEVRELNKDLSSSSKLDPTVVPPNLNIYNTINTLANSSSSSTSPNLPKDIPADPRERSALMMKVQKLLSAQGDKDVINRDGKPVPKNT